MPDLLAVTMGSAAADRFEAALMYAEAVCAGLAEANTAPDTARKIREHAEWLRWGVGRIVIARNAGLSDERAR